MLKKLILAVLGALLSGLNAEAESIKFTACPKRVPPGILRKGDYQIERIPFHFELNPEGQTNQVLYFANKSEGVVLENGKRRYSCSYVNAAGDQYTYSFVTVLRSCYPPARTHCEGSPSCAITCYLPIPLQSAK